MKLRWNWKRWPFALGVLLFSGAQALAHEKWFVDAHQMPSGPPVFALVSPMFGFGIVALAFISLLLFVWLDRRYDGSSLSRWMDAKMTTLRFNPRTVLGVSLGVSLMGAGLQGTLFSPNLVLPGSGWGIALGLAEIMLGSLFLFLEPLYAELGILLALLFLAGFSVIPPWELMEDLFVLGAGIFFMASETARAPWRLWNSPERRRMGYQVFRVLTGLNFLVLASVKWFRPELALEIVEKYHLNFVGWMGASGIQFVYIAAVIETFLALCILLRVAFRPALVFAFCFFVLSIYFLGFTELLGHLPIKATLFLFFIYGHWHKAEAKP